MKALNARIDSQEDPFQSAEYRKYKEESALSAAMRENSIHRQMQTDAVRTI